MPHPSLRAPLLVAAALAAPCGAWRLGGTSLRALLEPLRADGLDALAGLGLQAVLTGVLAALLLVGVAWLSGTTLLLTLLHLVALRAPGSGTLARVTRRVERTAPTLARGLVVAALGLGTGTAWAGPAHADPAAAPGHHPAATVQALDGLPMPDRATGGASPTVAAARQGAATVVVRRGDSLWSIAARLLPPGADDAEVGRAGEALYAANRDRLGPDPDLIHPGDRLTVPPVAHHREEPR